ncbi:MAG: type 1 glutamine amidotransferase [Cohaesibacter sp.]|jgi:GMP synthase-like glutamine amidotransferase|nr:type 1 glutamine amidotransferase [Cohaesibacter sp.]
MTLRLGILIADEMSAEATERFGPLSSMYHRFFRMADQNLEFADYKAFEGQLPDTVSDCDGWVVTGSKAGANDESDWMLKLEAFIRTAADENVPAIGICFGHQLMAKARGGRVERTSGNRWGIGVNHYAVEPTSLQGLRPLGQERISLHAMHQDQVVALPKGAQRLGGSDFCPNGIIVYPGRGLSMQQHPEIRQDFSQYLIRTRAGTHFDATAAEKALDAIGGPVDDKLIAHWLLDFIKDGPVSERQSAATA